MTSLIDLYSAPNREETYQIGRRVGYALGQEAAAAGSYNAGYEAGKKLEEQAYERGHAAGEKFGYDAGVTETERAIDEDVEIAKAEGYANGYDAAYGEATGVLTTALQKVLGPDEALAVIGTILEDLLVQSIFKAFGVESA